MSLLLYHYQHVVYSIGLNNKMCNNSIQYHILDKIMYLILFVIYSLLKKYDCILKKVLLSLSRLSKLYLFGE